MRYIGEGRTIEYIVIHHSEGFFGSLDFFDQLHRERGFPESKSGHHMGYHACVLTGYTSFEDLDGKKYRKDVD